MSNVSETYLFWRSDALRILGHIVEISLEYCEKQWDIINARGLMILVQKFYAKGRLLDDPQADGNVWSWPHLREKNESTSGMRT